MTAVHDGRRRVVAAADQAAAALGLRPGLAMAQALALVPGLEVVDAEPEADAEALRRLARWCVRTTPLASPCPPDGLWLDITGCAHLFGDEAGLLRQLLARLARDGLHGRAAVADTPGAAHALAHHGPGAQTVVPPGAQGEAIAPLPIAALRLAPELETTLRRVGFDLIGHLARIPRALLARRFGPLPGLRLDQAHGRVQEPLVPLMPEPVLERRVTFLEPLLTAEALQTATAHLVGLLCEEMERTGIGARQLDLLFERVDNQVAAIRIGTARPVRDPAHLLRLLIERLDTVDPGMGVEAMRLVVPLAEALRWEQQGGGDAGGEPDVARLVDRLSNRLGADRIYRAAPVESDIPERSVRRAFPLEAAPTDSVMAGLVPATHVVPLQQAKDGSAQRIPMPSCWTDVGHRNKSGDDSTPDPPAPLPWKPRHEPPRRTKAPGPPWPGRTHAPARLLHPPRPIHALAALPDEPPVAFTWRRHRHRIRRADGPERIHGEWWNSDAETKSVRDYFRVEDEVGRRFWLFREGDGLDPRTGGLAWFIHGVF